MWHESASIAYCVVSMECELPASVIPASCNLFLTVCELTRTPVAFWNSLLKVVTFENRWHLAWRTINRSWTGVVERSRRGPARHFQSFGIGSTSWRQRSWIPKDIGKVPLWTTSLQHSNNPAYLIYTKRTSNLSICHCF